MRCAILLAILMSPGAALAVVPLATDDADPVEFGHVQINAGWQFSRAESINLNSLYFIPVMGITSRSEFGTVFGYQWRGGVAGDDGITDLTLETKWRLLGNTEDNWRISARFDLKLPTASARDAFGTGNPDADSFLIATYTCGRTSLDWNVGYIKIDASRDAFNADEWFFGQALRRQLNSRWTLIGEIYATIPQGDVGAPANLNFDGGFQFSVRDNFLLSILVGSAAGSDSAELTANFGFTWTF